MRVHMNQPGAQVSQPGKGGWTTGLVDVEASSKGWMRGETLGNGAALLREAPGVSKSTLGRAWSNLG